MRADEIRTRFLSFFEQRGHAVLPSASLVPTDDPTLLFTNAGMVQFKRAFLGSEAPPAPRAATSQKCVRAGGKHNDLEQVGFTTRHHTFFEMLGNFSFGDYFKREAIAHAWELLTRELGLPVERLWVTVHHSDEEAAALWREIAGLPDGRIFRLGDADNFWQMADTGPCGPCSEIHFDLRGAAQRGRDLPAEEFVEKGERGEFLELWNLVFMQYDRGADGELRPLPAPSIDTGAGLERLAAVLQGVESNYDTDLFVPLLERVAAVLGRPYERDGAEGPAYRVIADHARATAFLLCDGVHPSNEGRGYVLRRILRRGVRYAWLLGRREPTLAAVVEEVIALMAGAFPQLAERRDLVLRTTRAEEECFLATIDEGMRRFDEIAPPGSSGTVSAGDAFRLYDTYGFPLDLTELMARERGWGVDVAGFELQLEEQRRRSRADRAAAGAGAGDGDFASGWETLAEGEQDFTGYAEREADTSLLAFRRDDGRVALQLARNPFYAEGGGQVSDRGSVEGDGWRMEVDEVRRIEGRIAVAGRVEGDFSPGPVRARVREPARTDTERNHTATHLLHAALRRVLGTHVQQQGSLVEPDRLRFDFSHTGPLTAAEVARVEDEVNRAVLANTQVCTEQVAHREALARGAMALFSEKYGDVVRVVDIPGVSLELCGGTHVASTGEIGLFRVVSESGVAAGVRRIEAVTGRAALERAGAERETLREAARLLRTREEALLGRLEALLAENRELERRLQRARQEGGGDLAGTLLASLQEVEGLGVLAATVHLEEADEVRALGDRLRADPRVGVVVLATAGERPALFAVASDQAIARGARADAVLREVAGLAGGRGGGRPHLAQGGVPDAGRLPEALAAVPEVVRTLLGGAG
jgi:alanyl-tRNA synthetase